MATRPFTARDESLDGLHPLDRPEDALTPVYRYQLNVVASSVAEVVQLAGGWLCDRARAGGDVNVLVAERDEADALSILGARAIDLDAEFGVLVKTVASAGALAVSANLLGSDTRIRDEVLRALRRGATEVTVLGENRPNAFGRQLEPVQRRMSCAARAFKSHAVAAAVGSTCSVDATETLFRIGAEVVHPLHSVCAGPT